MWLRIGKRGRWKSRSADCPDDVAEATKDLVPRENEDLSVYKVESVEEALRVAAAHAFTQRPRPADIDAIVLPDEAVAESGVEPMPVPMEELPPYLSERHHEIPGLQDPSMTSALAKASLHRGVTAMRLTKAKLKELADHVRAENGIEAAIPSRWKDYLEKR